MRKDKKIDLMIVGAQKAGTTSLKNYLNEHPSILSHPEVEFSYFRDEKLFQEDFNAVFDRHFTEGDDQAEVVIGKNIGICNDEASVKRLHLHNPDCKIVFVLREPVSRAYSSYSMEIYNGWDAREFSELKSLIQKEDKEDDMYRVFLGLGFYAEHLQYLYNYFPKSQVKLILFEELVKNPISICQDLFDWLDVEVNFEPNVKKEYNVTSKASSALMTKIIAKLRRKDSKIKWLAKKALPHSWFSKIGFQLIESNKSKAKAKPISAEMNAFLKEFYKSHNEKLQEMSGLDLKEWNSN